MATKTVLLFFYVQFSYSILINKSMKLELFSEIWSRKTQVKTHKTSEAGSRLKKNLTTGKGRMGITREKEDREKR